MKINVSDVSQISKDCAGPKREGGINFRPIYEFNLRRTPVMGSRHGRLIDLIGINLGQPKYSLLALINARSKIIKELLRSR